MSSLPFECPVCGALSGTPPSHDPDCASMARADLAKALATIEKVRAFCDAADSYGDEIETGEVRELLGS